MFLQNIVFDIYCVCVFLSSIYLLMTEIQRNNQKKNENREKKEQDIQIYVLYKFRRNVFLKKRQKTAKSLLYSSSYLQGEHQIRINSTLSLPFYIIKVIAKQYM
jgi:hypothetical protein